MKLYFFDTDDGVFRHQDEDGQCMADLDEARRSALMCLSGMVQDRLHTAGDQQHFSVDIRDKEGRIIYTACLSLAARRFP